MIKPKIPKIKIPQWIKDGIRQYQKDNQKDKRKKTYCKFHNQTMLTTNKDGDKLYCAKCKKWTKNSQK